MLLVKAVPFLSIRMSLMAKAFVMLKKINIYVCGCYLSVNFFVNIKAGVMYYIKIVLVFILFLFEGMYGRIMSQVVEYEDYILIH